MSDIELLALEYARVVLVAEKIAAEVKQADTTEELNRACLEYTRAYKNMESRRGQLLNEAMCFYSEQEFVGA